MTKQIYFMTSNKGKIASLNRYFEQNEIDIKIEPVNLGIVEPQANSVKDVSKVKALEAFDILKAPLVVEDGGLEIDALKGFPGVYVRYILDTIGAQGLVKLMEGEEDRTCRFASTTSFVDKNGELHQFESSGNEGQIVTKMRTTHSPYAWSDIWYIFYKPEFDKTLSEMTEEELYRNTQEEGDSSSLSKFIEWFKDNQDLV